jgi:hypothetical protein
MLKEEVPVRIMEEFVIGTILFMTNIENMNNMFKEMQLKKPSFMQKLFKQQPEANAVIELNNLFATNGILSIREEHVVEINKRYNINLYEEYSKNLLEFYASFLNDCLVNNKLSDHESNEIGHLKNLLKIDNSIAEKIKYDFCGTLYKKLYTEIVADGVMEGRKMEKLTQLQNKLHLSEEFTNAIQKEVNKEQLVTYLNKFINKGSMSPNEKTDFDIMVGSLGIKELITGEIKNTVNDLVTYWEIENQGLSPIEVDFKLPKGEECYFSIPANWREMKPSAAGQMHGKLRPNKITVKKPFPYRNTVDDRMADWGTLYLTNKKILFIGEKKHTIKLEVIDYIKPYSNGVAIDKEAGRDIFLEFSSRQDLFCLILGRMSNI